MLKGFMKVAGFGTDDDSSGEQVEPASLPVRQDGTADKLDSTQAEASPVKPRDGEGELASCEIEPSADNSAVPAEFRLPLASTAPAADGPANYESPTDDSPALNSGGLSEGIVTLYQQKQELPALMPANTMAKDSASQSATPLESHIEIGCVITEPPSPSDPYAKPTVSSGTATKAVARSRQSSGRIPRSSVGPNATVTIKQADSREAINSQIRYPEVHVKVLLPDSTPPGAVRVAPALPAKYSFISNDQTYARAAGRADNVQSERFQWSSNFGRPISAASESLSFTSGNPPDHHSRRSHADPQLMSGAQSDSSAPSWMDETKSHELGPEPQTSGPRTGGLDRFALEPNIQRLKRSPISDSSFSSDSTRISDGHDLRGDGSSSLSGSSAQVKSSLAADQDSGKPRQDGEPTALKQPSAFDEASAIQADVMTAPTWFLPNSLPTILASKEKAANLQPLEKGTPRPDAPNSFDIRPVTPMRDADIMMLPNSQKDNLSSLNNPTHEPIPRNSGVDAPQTPDPATKYMNYTIRQVENHAGSAGAAVTIDLTNESEQQSRRAINHHNRHTNDNAAPKHASDSHRGHGNDSKHGKGKDHDKAKRDHEYNSRARHEGYKRQEPKARDSYRPERDGRNGIRGKYESSNRDRRDVHGHIHNSDYRKRDAVMDYDYPRDDRDMGMNEERKLRMQRADRFDDAVLDVDKRSIGARRAQGYDIDFDRDRELRVGSYKGFDDDVPSRYRDSYEQRVRGEQRFNKDDLSVDRLESRTIASDHRVPIDDGIIPQRESPAALRKRYRTDDRLESDRDIDPIEQRVWRSLRNGGGSSNVPARLDGRDFDRYEQRIVLSQRLVDDSAVAARYDERLGRSPVDYCERAESSYLRRGDFDLPSSVKRQRIEYEELPRIRRQDTNIVYNDEDVLRQQTARIVQQELEAALGSIMRSSMSRAMLDRP
ncbi:hypothetical protein HDU87_008547 [Geranomyces variabilis]|uniref:Uncharacterized protein n=1 Tax=Geranomyces variabilis TaxID=109894 RepID=A0AAD5TPE2_9FUNG|nr:hypothetical protein HDU87_008547 [Geranomyces variabilis]